MKLHKDGFLKVTLPEHPNLEAKQRVVLIRKANQMFNEGEIEQASRIFTTLRYTDGINRAGDHYYKQGDFWNAFRLYTLAPSPEKRKYMIKQMSMVIREWMNE